MTDQELLVMQRLEPHQAEERIYAFGRRQLVI